MGELRSQSWQRRTLRRTINWLLGFRGSPRQIARGLAIGVIVAFSPTMGVQMAIAAVLATITCSSRAAAVAAVWLTNPLTAMPLYTLTYRVGGWFIPTAGIAEFRHRLHMIIVDDAGEWMDLPHQVMEVVRLGGDILVPLTIGGAILGIAAGAMTYLASLWLIELGKRGRAAGRTRPPLLEAATPDAAHRSKRVA